MKILSYLCSILMLIGLAAMAQGSNSPPEVTNVVAQQVGQQVEISYDLMDRDGDLMTVSLLVSSDGGSNFDLEATSLEGEVGEGIASGQGKRVRQLQLGLVASGRYVAADHAAYWNGKTETGEAIASGTYFLTIQTHK